jgi:predicted Rossmann fold nucleotide-binding protein DprA/Smf involved in DNA uptake
MNKVAKATTGTVTIPASTSTTTATGTISLSLPSSGRVAGRRVETKKIESAVYAHIQALRALGRTQVEPQEIARALGLSVSQVQNTIAALKSKGVKAVHAS